MSWYRITLSSRQVAQKLVQKIQRNFTEVWKEYKMPKGMALLISNNTNVSELILETHLYVSPAAVYPLRGVIQEFKGQASTEPILAESNFLAGDTAVLWKQQKS